VEREIVVSEADRPGRDGGLVQSGLAITDRRAFLTRALIGGAALLPAGSLLAACGGKAKVGPGAGAKASTPVQSGAAPTKPTGVLRVANLAEPNFIDPANALEVDEFAIVRNVYDGLMEWNDDYSDLAPALATSWKANDDATEWTLQLRDGVTFHDGSKFDSTAAKKSIQYYIGKTWGLLYDGLKSIDDSDPSVLVVKFKAPSPDFDRNCTFTKILAPALTETKDAAAKKAVGSGPFTFKEWQKGQQVVLEANPNAWQDKGPYVQEIQLKTIADPTVQLNALRSGSSDVMMRVSAEQQKELTSDSKFHVLSTPSWLELHLTFRCDQKPFTDARVRQAVAYGIDREAIVKNVLLEQGVVATSPIPTGCAGHVDPETKYAYDPEKAKSLLAEAGFKSGLKIKIGTGDPRQSLVGQAMVQQLKAAGITASFQTQEAGILVADLAAKKPKHDCFILTYGWITGAPFHFATKLVVVHPQYTGKKLVGMIDQCNRTANGDARDQLLADTQELYMQEIPHLPLYYAKLTDATAAKVAGWRVAKDAYQPAMGTVYLST
jgi:peptide/nickel transport system substrate-binding protein